MGDRNVHPQVAFDLEIPCPISSDRHVCRLPMGSTSATLVLPLVVTVLYVAGKSSTYGYGTNLPQGLRHEGSTSFHDVQR